MKKIIRRALIVVLVSFVCSCANVKDKYPAEIIEGSCNKNSVQVFKRLEVADLYIDRTYLRIVSRPYDETYHFNDLIEFLFQAKLKSLETTNREKDGNSLIFSLRDTQDNKFIRVSIEKIGSPSCKLYNYPRIYPAQALPWLRKLGLGVNECIGITSSATQVSTTGIYVNEYIVGKQFNGVDWQKRLEVRLEGVSAGLPITAATIVDHYAFTSGAKGGSYHYFPCKTEDSQFKVFREAFHSSGNPKINPPEIINVPPNKLFDSYPQASDKYLSSLKWLRRSGEVWASNIINEDGTVWLDRDASKNPLGYMFNVASDGKIYSVPVVIPGKGLQSVTGLAKTSNGYAIVAFLGISNAAKYYVVEFSAVGQVVYLAAISSAQYEKLQEL